MTRTRQSLETSYTAPGAQQNRVHDDWTRCPITKLPMKEPVLFKDGWSCEREAAERWVAAHPGISPSSGLKLPDSSFTPNEPLKKAIQRYFDGKDTWWVGLTRQHFNPGSIMEAPMMLVGDGHVYDECEVRYNLPRQMVSPFTGQAYRNFEEVIADQAMREMVAAVYNREPVRSSSPTQKTILMGHRRWLQDALGLGSLLALAAGSVGGSLGGVLGGGPDGSTSNMKSSPLLGVVLGVAVPLGIMVTAAAIGIYADSVRWRNQVAATAHLRGEAEALHRPSLVEFLRESWHHWRGTHAHAVTPKTALVEHPELPV